MSNTILSYTSKAKEELLQGRQKLTSGFKAECEQ